MKKLLTILSLLITTICFSQRPIQPLGTKANEVKVLGALSIDSALFVTPYATLAAANIPGQYARTRGGSIIFVKNESALYMRNDAATAWIKMAAASDIPPLYTSEDAQDAVGAMINASLQYVDATPLLAINDRDFGSITTSGGGLIWTIDAGSITNGMLVNSSITVNGTSIALGASGTLVLASANFANQGTATTLLHGNAAGNPTWAAVSLTADVTGRLPVANFAQIPANSVVANTTASAADLTALVLSANQLVGRGSTGNVSNITVAGTLSFSGTVLTGTGITSEVDGSTTNELQTYAHTGTTSYTNTLSLGGGSFTLQSSGIVTISNTAGTVTIGATEVDGSVSNELQTIANTSNATSHTVTLSNSGGSVQFVEGTGITLTTTGTSAAGIITIASTATGGITGTVAATQVAYGSGVNTITSTSDFTFVSGLLTLNKATGTNLLLGNSTGVLTATPVVLDLGGTASNVAGGNLKLKLYNDGVSTFGLGVSTSSIDYVMPETNGFHSFYIGATGAKRFTVHQSGATIWGDGALYYENNYVPKLIFYIGGGGATTDYSIGTSATALRYLVPAGVTHSFVQAFTNFFQLGGTTATAYLYGLAPTVVASMIDLPVGYTADAFQVKNSGGVVYKIAASGATTIYSTLNVTGNGTFTGGLESYVGVGGDNSNFRAGNGALVSLTTGLNNVSLGKQAGQGISTQHNNISIGYLSNSTNPGNANISIGTLAHRGIGGGGDDNIAIGNTVMQNASGTNSGNIAIGTLALANLGGGTGNVSIGLNSGYQLQGGSSSNVFVGTSNATYINLASSNNVMVGARIAAESNISGYNINNNVYVGQAAAQYAIGSGNIFIGQGVGASSTESNRLKIGSIIDGDVALGGTLGVKGTLNVTAPYSPTIAHFKSEFYLQYGGIGIEAGNRAELYYYVGGAFKWETFVQPDGVGNADYSWFNPTRGQQAMHIEGASNYLFVGHSGTGYDLQMEATRKLTVYENGGDHYTVFPLMRLWRSSNNDITSGTTGIEMALGNNQIVGSFFETGMSDMTVGSEDAYFRLNLMQNGAAYAPRFQVNSTGDVAIWNMNQDDAEAKVVVWNSTDKILEWRAASTLTGGAGGGYTNMTQFLTQTPYRLFISDLNGDVQELAYGTSGQVLISNGASANPSWGTPSGAGETNTASNLGGGLSNYSTKVGVDLRFNTFNGNDFELATNLISIDYVNGQAASATLKGFVTSADYLSFSGKNAGIQFRDEGTALGAAITVNEVDFVGVGVTAARSTNKVTVTIAGASATRFGVTGEDATAAENRIFNITNNSFEYTLGISGSAGGLLIGKNSGDSYGEISATLYSTDLTTTAQMAVNREAGTGAMMANIGITGSTNENAMFIFLRGSATLTIGSSSVFKIDGIASAAGTKELRYDPATKAVTYFDIPTGGSGGGYTLLSQFVDETAWRMYYSNVSGDVTPFALGTSGQVLQSNGVSAAPTWVTPSGGGEVNTAANLGGGLSNYAAKVGAELKFNTFSATDFILSFNVISINYAAGQAASGTLQGFLSSADWTAFNGKQSGIQYRDEGTALGAAGTVNEIDFVGGGVTVTRATNKLTVTMSGGSVALSAITASVADNAINNVNFNSIWNWNSLGTTANGSNQLGLYLSSTAASTVSTTLFQVGKGGTAGAATITTAADIRATATGGNINAALQLEANGATNNYIIRSGSGDIEMKGTLQMQGTTSGEVTIKPQAAAGVWTMTLPNTAGNANEFLKTDGSGGLSWAAAGGASGITIGTTTITGGTSTRILYNNAGVVGEYVVTGSGNVVMSTSPIFRSDITLGIVGTATGNVNFVGSSGSGGVQLTVPDASAAATVYLPIVASTLSNYNDASIVSNAVWSPYGGARENYYDVTLQAAAVTTISTPSGLALNHNTLIIRARCDGTNRAIAGWSGIFRASPNLAFPTTLTANKTMYIKFVYSLTDSKWDLVSVLDQFQ